MSKERRNAAQRRLNNRLTTGAILHLADEQNVMLCDKRDAV